MLILAFPGLPFLVVIKITPFAARDPYNEVAEASFKTVKLWISLGLSPAMVLEFPPDISPLTTGIPSITYNGAAPALIDPIPLIRTLGTDPGCPLPF